MRQGPDPGGPGRQCSGVAIGGQVDAVARSYGHQRESELVTQLPIPRRRHGKDSWQKVWSGLPGLAPAMNHDPDPAKECPWLLT